MSEQGAALQKYNQELVKSTLCRLTNLESLKSKRSELMMIISREQEERDELETSVNELQKKLTILNESLKEKYEAKANYDKIIEETETVYMKILESSQVLLSKLRQECQSLGK